MKSTAVLKNLKAAFKRGMSFAKDRPRDGEDSDGEEGGCEREDSMISQDAGFAAPAVDRLPSSLGNPAGMTSAPPSPSPMAKTTAAADSGAVQASARSHSAANRSSSYPSVTIAVAEHCPPALWREQWSLEDLEIKKQMYNGPISMVYHAIDKRSGISLALKLYKRAKLTEIERHQVAREIKLHIELNHSSIIALYAAWKDRNFVYLALEWAPGGDVYAFMKLHGGKLSEDVAVPLILEPFLSAIKYIHERGLIHRDIKPENILMNSSFQIKIADFGLSIDSSDEVANTRLGTIDYLAPEILDCPVKQHPMDNKDNPQIGYSNKVDCWSCGVLAYELLCGKPPFESTSAHETLKRIKYKKVEFPPDMSAGSISFITAALVRDPEDRASIEDLLNQPWIKSFGRRREDLAKKRGTVKRSPTFGAQSSQLQEALATAEEAQEASTNSHQNALKRNVTFAANRSPKAPPPGVLSADPPSSPPAKTGHGALPYGWDNETGIDGMRSAKSYSGPMASVAAEKLRRPA